MSEEVIARVNETKLYFNEKPLGWPKGGHLVITNKTLVFISGIYGPVDIEWGLRIKGSFTIPLNDIIEAKAERYLGTPFLKMHYRTTNGEEKTCSFIFSSKITLAEAALLGYLGGLPRILMGAAFGVPSLSKTPYEQIANTIETLKKAHEQTTRK